MRGWLATMYESSPPVQAARSPAGASHRSVTTLATLCFLLPRLDAR